MQNNDKGFKLLWTSNPHYGQTSFELSTEKTGTIKEQWEEYLKDPDNFYKWSHHIGNYLNNKDSIKEIHCDMCTALRINNAHRYCQQCEYYLDYFEILNKIKNNEYEEIWPKIKSGEYKDIIWEKIQKEKINNEK